MRLLPSPLPTATLVAILAVALPGCLAPDTADVRSPDSTVTTSRSTPPPPSDTLAWRTETVALAGSECDAQEGWGCSTVDLVRPVLAEGLPPDHPHRAVAEVADEWTYSEIARRLTLGGQVPGDLESRAKGFLDAVDRDLREHPRTPPAYVDLTVGVVRNDGQVLSLELRGSTYGGGAAHPLPHIEHLNLALAPDPRGGDPTPPELDDLLVDGGTAALLAYAADALRRDAGIGADAPLSEGGLFSDELELPSRFLATRDGLRMSWNVYEIAAYARGPIEVVVPWSVAEPWLVDPGRWVP